MIQIIKTTGVLVFNKNRVLLVCHKKGSGHLNNTYGLPAGHINLDETYIEAASRELMEETGLSEKLLM